MKVIEQFTQGKTGDENLNEDRIVVTDDFVAVIDGVTPCADVTLQGMSTGRFAAIVLLEGVKELHPLITARDAVTRLTSRMEDHTTAAAEKEGKEKEFSDTAVWPGAGLLIYSHRLAEIWRLGGYGFSLDGGPADTFTTPQEESWRQLRSSYLQAQLEKGVSERDLLAGDPSMKKFAETVVEMRALANSDAPAGYGVLNGTPVPDRHIEVIDIDEIEEITLASDGYPEILPTLEASEARLKQLIAQDPLMYKACPQTRGVTPGAVSFDDRSYIRFKL
ncbi:MAG: hypothetical protein GC185_03875 [Alphaproteobacteria bacterium]|nr:hypothetical protein [Alphaproteobacteria bacterium]